MAGNSTNIVDQAVEFDGNEPLEQKDLIGILRYEQGLKAFIQRADTPLTIALQGEWGSGKTSLMNFLRRDLTENDAMFYPVWVNTWQHAMMKSPANAIVGILKDIICQLGKAKNPKQSAPHRNRISSMLGKAAKIASVAALNVAGRFSGMGAVGTDIQNAAAKEEADAGGVSELNGESEVAGLKKVIAEYIEEFLKSVDNVGRKGFLFFIDDLDRIDPPLAVQLLELLKNIFDLKHCIYILALDYDVVVKGLKPKFGEPTPENEREFRSFFDKIIQLPFTMPVAAYSVDRFLVDTLLHISFLTQEEAGDPGMMLNLSKMVKWSVGLNPRSLKRLANTLSLINLISLNANEQEQGRIDKQIHFALVCLQIAYPQIYNKLQAQPDFCDPKWGEKLGLEEGTTENPDTPPMEGYKRALERICLTTYLQQHKRDIYSLLESIEDLVEEGNGAKEESEKENVGGAVKRLISFSDITSVHDAAETVVAAPEDFDVSWSLKDHMWALVESIKPLLQGCATLVCTNQRVRGILHYQLTYTRYPEQPLKMDMTMGHDDKCYFLRMWYGHTYLMNGRSADRLAEEEALGQRGCMDEVSEKLDELQAQYQPGCTLGHVYGYEPAVGNYWYQTDCVFAYPTWDKMVSQDAIDTVARFLNKLFRIVEPLCLVQVAKQE